MFRTFQLFSVLGIPVRVHSSLLILLVLLGVLLSPGTGLPGLLATIAFLALVFLFVLLHELGHAVTALACGVGVRHIILHPLGGVAALSHMPRDPGKELAITIAGPAVNFALAGILALGWLVVPVEFLRLLVTANLVLGVFNLLPGFPMDGGRILRAWLARRRPYEEATAIAARTGQVVAVIMGLVGVLTVQLMLVAIAVFVWMAARMELLQATSAGPWQVVMPERN